MRWPDGGVGQADEQVGLAGAGWADEQDVLGGADPFQRRQVGEGRGRDRRGGLLEVVECFDHGQVRGAQAVGEVGRVAGGDLGFDEGA